MLTTVPDPRQFGVAELDEAGQVVGLVEKPRCPRSDLALAGVYIFSPAVHEAVRQLSPSGRGELEITEAIQWLIDTGHTVRSTIISGYWKDTGNVADMLEVNRMVLESAEALQHGAVDDATEIIGRVVIEPGARVSRSRIVGPASLARGPDVTVPMSALSPPSPRAAPSSTARSSTPSSCAGPPSSGVRRIEASIIGHEVEVTPASRVPKAHRLILGDHSKVQISS